MTSMTGYLRRAVCAMLVVSSAGAAAAADAIVFWHSRDRHAMQVIAESAQRFSREAGVRVDVQFKENGDFRTALLRESHEGELPDVVLIPGDFLSMTKELRFSEIPESAQTKHLVRNAAQAGMHQGRQLGAPITWGNHLVLYYNRGLVRQPARSFADLERQVPELTAKGVRPLAAAFGEMYSFVPFMAAFGGWPLDEAGRIRLNEPATVDALDFYFALAQKGVLDKDCAADCTAEHFAAGRYAYAISGDWLYREFEQKLGARFGVAPLPSVDGRPLVSMFSSYVLAFPKDGLRGPKREPLLKFIRFMQSPEVQRRWAHKAGLLPVNDKVFEEVKAAADDNKKIFLEQLRSARVMPNDRHMAYAWDGLAKGFLFLTRKRGTPAQAAGVMQAQAEKTVARDK